MVGIAPSGRYIYRSRRQAKRKIKSNRLVREAELYSAIKKYSGEKCINFFEVAGENVNVGVLTAYQLGANIVKGTNRGNRKGDNIMITGVKVTMTVYNPSTNALAGARGRLILATSKRTGELPNVNMWEGATSANNPRDYQTSATVSYPEQLVRALYRTKYITHYDRIIDAPFTGTGTTNSKLVPVKFYVPMKIRMTFKDGTDAKSDVMPNMWFMYHFERDDAGKFSTSPEYIRTNYNICVYFRDI